MIRAIIAFFRAVLLDRRLASLEQEHTYHREQLYYHAEQAARMRKSIEQVRAEIGNLPGGVHSASVHQLGASRR